MQAYGADVVLSACGEHCRMFPAAWQAVPGLIDTAIDNGYGTPRVVCPSVKPAPKTARQEGRQ